MADKLYEIMIESKEEGKKIICDATQDTSLKNIKNMLKSGLAEIYDLNGKKIVLKENQELEYENGNEVKYSEFEKGSGINMLRIEIRPNLDKMKKKRKEVQKMIEKAHQHARMNGRKKEEGIDELRKEVREDNTRR